MEAQLQLLLPLMSKSLWVLFINLGVGRILLLGGVFQVALAVKNLPASVGDVEWLQSLGWEDPLEEEMAPHCSLLAWRIPWTEEPGRLWSITLQKVGYN